MRQVTTTDADAIIKHIRREIEYRIRGFDEGTRAFLRNILIDVQYDTTIRLNNNEFQRTSCAVDTERKGEST